MPQWLVDRQLNEHLFHHGFLPRDIDVEDLVSIVDEENEEEGPYTPDLMGILNQIDQAFVHYLRSDPVFFREIYEPWYCDTLAPHIQESKLPLSPPPINFNDSSGSGVAIWIGLLVIILISAYFLVASLFPSGLHQSLARLLHF